MPRGKGKKGYEKLLEAPKKGYGTKTVEEKGKKPKAPKKPKEPKAPKAPKEPKVKRTILKNHKTMYLSHANVTTSIPLKDYEARRKEQRHPSNSTIKFLRYGEGGSFTAAHTVAGEKFKTPPTGKTVVTHDGRGANTMHRAHYETK